MARPNNMLVEVSSNLHFNYMHSKRILFAPPYLMMHNVMSLFKVKLYAAHQSREYIVIYILKLLLFY
jgi:hypothetical protein